MTKLLAEIKAAMDVSPFYALKTKKAVAALVEAGQAELNEGITEGKGATAKFAVRLTEAGVAALNAAPAAAPAKAPVAAAEPVVFEGFVPQRIRSTGSKYPLDTLAVGQSLFYASTEPKRLSSSLSTAATGAAKRSGVKRFSVSTVKAGVAYGSMTPPSDGVVVTRIADKTAA